MPTENQHLSIWPVFHGFAKHLAGRPAGEEGKPVRTGSFAFVPAGLTEGRHVGKHDDGLEPIERFRKNLFEVSGRLITQFHQPAEQFVAPLAFQLGDELEVVQLDRAGIETPEPRVAPSTMSHQTDLGREFDHPGTGDDRFERRAARTITPIRKDVEPS